MENLHTTAVSSLKSFSNDRRSSVEFLHAITHLLSISVIVTAGVVTLIFSCLISQPPACIWDVPSWIIISLIKAAFVSCCCWCAWRVLGRSIKGSSKASELQTSHRFPSCAVGASHIGEVQDDQNQIEQRTSSGGDLIDSASLHSDSGSGSGNSCSADGGGESKTASGEDETLPNSAIDSSTLNIMLQSRSQILNFDGLHTGQIVCMFIHQTNKYICVHKHKETVTHRYPVLGTYIGSKITLEDISELQSCCPEEYSRFCFQLVFDSGSIAFRSLSTKTMLHLMGNDFFNSGYILVAYHTKASENEELERFDLERVDEGDGVFLMKKEARYIVWSEEKKTFTTTFRRDEASRICIEQPKIGKLE